MANKLGILIVLATVLVLSGISSANALNVTDITANWATGFPDGFVNQNEQIRINITLWTNNSDGIFNYSTGGTLNNTAPLNITQVLFTLGSGATYSVAQNPNGSNDTSLTGWAFTNTSNTVVWTYVPAVPTSTRFTNETSHSFVFNMTASNPGDSRQLITMQVNDSAHTNLTLFTLVLNNTNRTRISGQNLSNQFTVNFQFAGSVKNESGSLVNSTNVTVYRFVTQAGGPPVEMMAGSVLTEGNGTFSFKGVNATGYAAGAAYTTKFVYYNQALWYNATAVVFSGQQAMKTGPLLPAFIGVMYAPASRGDGVDMFNAMPSINGTTFSLVPATTLNITAHNTTIAQKFGYEVTDIASGFPIDSKILGSGTSASVVVPTGRDYNVMVVRDPTIFAAIGVCDGKFMNNSNCPVPPKSNSSTGTLTATEGSTTSVAFNLTTVTGSLWGCIGVTGNTTAITNVSAIYPRMLPYAGFVPPLKADAGNIGILTNETQLNYTSTRCRTSAYIAEYNIPLLSATYLIDFYGAGNYTAPLVGTVGWVQNITIGGGATNYNITMSPLFGADFSAFAIANSTVNATKIRFNATNSSSGILTRAPNLELTVYYPHTGRLRYIIDTDTFSGGAFFFPIVNTTGAWAKTTVFGNGPPVETKVTLASNTTSIVVDDAGGFGFRRLLANGTLDADYNVSASPIQMRFMTYGTASNGENCNVINPSAACEIANMTASNFNPFKVLVAGKVNLEMKILSSGVTVTYVNYDMFQAKPPTNTIFDESANITDSVESWQFGGYAPADAYDTVIVGMPYTEANMDETRIRIKIPLLYDQDLNVIWNRTAGNTASDLTYEYASLKATTYNSSGFVDYLTDNGVACDSRNNNITSFTCFVNVSMNIAYMRVPHFSATSPSVFTGAAAATAAASSSSGSSGGGGGGGGLNEPKSTTLLASIAAGIPTAISVDGSKIGVSEVVLETLYPASDVTFSTTKLASKPSTVDVAPNVVYNYINFVTSLPDTSLQKATVKFQVKKSWLTENSIDKTTVALQHWKDNKWVDLGSTLKSEDSENVYYEAITHSFSTFAITGQKLAGAAGATTGTTGKAGTKTTAGGTTGTQAASSTVLLVVLLIAVIGIFAYLTMQKKRRR
ncbi:MAG: PGF-pre-PGF domain-containing protein [Nanoarchaeota archaeon]